MKISQNVHSGKGHKQDFYLLAKLSQEQLFLRKVQNRFLRILGAGLLKNKRIYEQLLQDYYHRKIYRQHFYLYGKMSRKQLFRGKPFFKIFDAVQN